MPRILLIDNDEWNRDMLERRLGRAGYSVLCVTTGERGIEVAHEQLPDLILMAPRLPDISGLDAAERLKHDLATSQIPLVALTAQAMQGSRERALAAGYDEYETKPVDMPRLLEKIARLLERGPDTPPHRSDGDTTLPA